MIDGTSEASSPHLAEELAIVTGFETVDVTDVTTREQPAPALAPVLVRVSDGHHPDLVALPLLGMSRHHATRNIVRGENQGGGVWVMERRAPVGHPSDEKVKDRLPAPQFAEMGVLREECPKGGGILGVDRRAVVCHQITDRLPRLDSVD